MSPVTNHLGLPVMRVVNCNENDAWRKHIRPRSKGRAKLNIKAVPERPSCPGIYDRITGSQLRLQQRLQLRAQLADALCIDRVHGFTQQQNERPPTKTQARA